MLTESCGRSITVVHDSSGKWLGQYETEDAAVEMLREMAKDTGGYSDEI